MYDNATDMLSVDVTNDSNDVVEEVVDVPTDQNLNQEIVENKEVVEEDQPITKVKNIGKVSPVVRRLASENNIDLESVQGTGKDGRVTRKDIDPYINNGSGKISSEEKPLTTQTKSADIGTSEIPRLRKKIAENMILSKQTSAHVMTSVEVDFENVENIRSKVKDKFKEENNFSLTYLPFIATAVVSALREHSVVNSSFDLDKGVHTVHENIELGIAVDINQEGLLVGSIREADSYNLKGTARKISEISKLLRDGKYNLDDVTGSTFTISNNGSFNSFLTSPIINQPNVAILSTESVKKRPVVLEMDDGSDSIAIRHVGILSLTWDHRAFDGSTALMFLNSIKNKLENTDWSQEIS